MPAFARHCLLSCLFLSLLTAISLPAHANSVSVTGTGYLGNNQDGLSANAGIFSATSAAPDGPSFLTGPLQVGVATKLSWTSFAFPGPGFTVVNVGKQFTDILQGGILFTASFTVPASALITGQFTAPVHLSGDLEAFQDLSLGQGFYTQGPQIATLLFTGTGTATFDLNNLGNGNFQIMGAFATYSGMGTLQTVVPEPTSLLLMGTGLVGFAALVRRRRTLLQLARKQALILSPRL